LVNKEIEYFPKADEEPMTTTIAIKCDTGVVIIRDSQLSSPNIKDLRGSKIFPINKFVALGAAGSVDQMKLLV
jgi:20S proteasome alpha/beta subunit